MIYSIGFPTKSRDKGIPAEPSGKGAPLTWHPAAVIFKPLEHNNSLEVRVQQRVFLVHGVAAAGYVEQDGITLADA